MFKIISGLQQLKIKKETYEQYEKSVRIINEAIRLLEKLDSYKAEIEQLRLDNNKLKESRENMGKEINRLNDVIHILKENRDRR